MRRRHHLQVSTFPFLAVLLCAMGSLILLLLVIDRRAKAVARLKVEAAIAQEAARDQEADAQRQAEWERRRRELHSRLASENQDVAAQLGTLEKKAVETAGRLRDARAQGMTLDQQLSIARTSLDQWENQLSLKRAQSDKAAREKQDGKNDLTQLTAELLRLETTLNELKTARRQSSQMYSLVPYRGQRGDNRKPIYIECTADGVILHPDRLSLCGPSVGLLDVRKEIERRLVNSPQIQTNSGTGATANSYLLLLVRPGGVSTYYRVLRSLDGLKVDYGYELLDQEWILDFPRDGETPLQQPWMLAQQVDSPRPPSSNARRIQGLKSNGSIPEPVGSSTAPGVSQRDSSTPPAELESPRPAVAGSPHALEGMTGMGAAQGTSFLPFPGTGTQPGANSTAAIPGSGTTFGSVPLRRFEQTPLAGADRGVAGPTFGYGGRGQPSSFPGTDRAGRIGDDGTTGRPATLGRDALPLGNTSSARAEGTQSVPATSAPLSIEPAPGSGQGQAGVLPGGSGGNAGSASNGSHWTGPEMTRAESSPASSPLVSIDPPVPLMPHGAGGAGTAGSTPAAGSAADFGRAAGAGPGGANSMNTGGAGSGGANSTNTGGTPGGEGNTAFDGGAGISAPQPGSNASTPGTGRPAGESGGAAGQSGSGPQPGGGSAAMGTAQTSTTNAGQAPDVGGIGGPPDPLDRLGSSRPRRKNVQPLTLGPRLWDNNRDWIISIECKPDALIIGPTQERISTDIIMSAEGSQSLVDKIKKLIDRRQATVPDGVPPYRPMIRFRVPPGGLRSYYMVYPVLEVLHVPMTRENIDRTDESNKKALGL
jgi:hypothetical protein